MSSPKVQIRRGQLWTLNDFQKLLKDTNWIWSTIELTIQELSDLFQNLQSNKDLNSPRKLSAEAERELTLVEKKLQDVRVDCLDPELEHILEILSSMHSPTGILMQRGDSILEWMDHLYHTNWVKKLKTYVEMVSELILKGKLKTLEINRNRHSRNCTTFY